MRETPAARPRPDFWPLTRLIIVAGVLYSIERLVYGWQIDSGAALDLLRRIALTFFGVAFISVRLAGASLFVLMLPLHAVVLLNDWLYIGTRWTLRTLLRIRSRWVLALLSLCGELALFAAALVLLRRFFAGL